VALPLPPDQPPGVSWGAFWLELLDVAVGASADRPVIVLGNSPPRLVVFYRPPEGPDLAAVLSSLDMAPIDDIAEPWQALPAPGSERARAVDTILTHSTADTLADILARLRSVTNA
jgi:hypothetical protein